MAEEQNNKTPIRGYQDNSIDVYHRLPAPNNENYTEETAAEIAAPVTIRRPVTGNQTANQTNAQAGGSGIGLAALALSIISLFVLPILFGAAGIILGFVARRRGAESLGNWAIGIGAIAIIVGMFILPFF